MIEFIKLKEDHLEQVLEWRTSENVTKFMYTDIPNNLTNQRKWFNRISDSLTEKYWIISIKGISTGVISLNELDIANKKTSWSFYIGDDKYRIYGGLVPPYLYNYVFYRLNLNKITAEIMEGNDNVKKIHRLHGYRDVGMYKDHIYKYDKFHNVYIMELLRNNWDLQADKFKNSIQDFED